jgi:hypothetical protein
VGSGPRSHPELSYALVATGVRSVSLDGTTKGADHLVSASASSSSMRLQPSSCCVAVTEVVVVVVGNWWSVVVVIGGEWVQAKSADSADAE